MEITAMAITAEVKILDNDGNIKDVFKIAPSEIRACGISTKYVFEFEYNELNIKHKAALKTAINSVYGLTSALPPVEPEKCGDIGEISDGYHTFNQLYHQRAILFATIVNQNKGISWKSYKHSDGKYCFDSDGEWFVVGIDTPKGSYTYHYSKEYWDYFDCIELERGKEWDGHTEDDVIRLLSLASVEPERKTGKWIDGKCNRCGKHAPFWAMSTEYHCGDFCPSCGAKMEVEG